MNMEQEDTMYIDENMGGERTEHFKRKIGFRKPQREA